jgi:hypothetical protein
MAFGARYPAAQSALGHFPVMIWIAHLSADYGVCEQKSCDGESGYASLMYPVPNPMYPLPIGSTLRNATIERNRDKDRYHRNKNQDRIHCKQD